MEIKKFLPLLLLSVTLTACVETIQRKQTTNATAAEYVVNKEDLQSRINNIIPSEEINITTSVTESTGKPTFKTLHVELVHPAKFPSNRATFSNQAGEIREAVEKSISNMDDFQKLEVVVRHSIEENGTERSRSYRREIDL